MLMISYTLCWRKNIGLLLGFNLKNDAELWYAQNGDKFLKKPSLSCLNGARSLYCIYTVIGNLG